MADIVARLTPLPAPWDTNLPDIAPGTVAFFKDGNWNSARFDVNIDDSAPNQRHVVTSWMFDQASWVAFNLGVGTVLTALDDVELNTDEKNIAALAKCGKSVDFVGNGKTRAVDLGAVNMNDCISAYFWRTVDLNLGAIEFFEHVFEGNRSTIFLSEWNSGTVHPIVDWFLHDRITSVRWHALGDRATVKLYTNTDGSGNQYGEIKGYGRTREISNLDHVGFNDQASAFKWTGVIPKREIIAPLKLTLDNVDSAQGLTASHVETNDSSADQPFVLELNKEDAQEVTTTAMDQHVAGIHATYTASAEASIGIASARTEWSVGLKYEYTRADTRSRTQRQTIALKMSQTVNAPAFTQTVASILVTIGQIPATTYHTTAERWYDVALTGTTPDEGLFRRKEPVKVSISGSLAVKSKVDIKATPLVKEGAKIQVLKQGAVGAGAAMAEVA